MLERILQTDEDVLREDCAQSLPTVGDRNILQRRKIGLLCSIKCPGDIILKTLDLMQDIRNSEVCVVSGFHSPLERECLRVLLKGSCGLIVCPARGLDEMRIPSEYRGPLASGRLLLLSAFGPDCRRKSKASAEVRNRLVAAVSDALLVPYASPGGRTEELCREMINRRSVHTVESSYNANLIELGVSIEATICK